jgi:hypothetical protein
MIRGGIEMKPEMIETPASTNLARFGYDSEGKALQIEFKNGTDAYLYENVPEEVYKAMKSIVEHKESVGGYFHQNIRGKYRYSIVKV